MIRRIFKRNLNYIESVLNILDIFLCNAHTYQNIKNKKHLFTIMGVKILDKI